jgi:hypothetical protein
MEGGQLDQTKTFHSPLKIPNHKFQFTDKSPHAAQAPALRVIKIPNLFGTLDVGI